MTRSFRFGVQTKTATTRTEWVEKARRIESLGYSTLCMPDHFDDQLAPAVALMSAADATETLRVGALVWCNDYRHPVVLAKEAATLDLLSEGRLELGIGAGWMRSDYEQAGLPYDRPGLRIDRMTETIHILKGLFAPGVFNFKGEHYTVTDLEGTPKPVQQPHPPILIGGGGPRFLRLAGRLADIVGVNFNLASGVISAELGSDATAERFAEKLAWVAEGAGDRFESLDLQNRVFLVSVTNDRQAMAETLSAGFGLSAEQGLASPVALVGTPAQIVEDLRQRRETLGFNYIVIGDDQVDAFAPVVAELAGT